MTISSLGVGSGLDAESIITSLLQLEKRPLTALQEQEKGIKTKVSSFGQMQSLFSDLQNASRELSSPLLWGQATGTSSNPAAVTVSAGSGAPLGRLQRVGDEPRGGADRHQRPLRLLRRHARHRHPHDHARRSGPATR